ncbi:hypothetical protein [Staphylococcus aureus]|uniref:hypothetical protein n=1 Tax=Staphylococcus aureus TaxID=1280 RepID=UPI000DE2E5B4|nr:hypothetical protein [Staphylococcus aureus]MDN8674517.1 hypothetical protein [Staphylococcus aureus]MDN8977690.1 hypothetical protein [Staphylococcus aureus]
MAEKFREEDGIRIREDYGFKAGLRQKALDIIRRNEVLEKFKIPYAITMKGLLMLIVGLAVPNFIYFTTLTNDGERAKFIALGFTCLNIGVCLLVALGSLYMPSYGSPLKSGWTLLKHFYKRVLIKMGLRGYERETGHTRVRSDGIVLYPEGDYGVWYKVDGRTSATAYPTEIMSQEETLSRYHNGRLHSTSEFHVTISQRQNTEKQIKYQESLFNSTDKQAIRDLCTIEIKNLDEYVNGVKHVKEHYLMQRDSSEMRLRESEDRLKRFVSRDNMYNSIERLNKEKCEELLDSIYKFK